MGYLDPPGGRMSITACPFCASVVDWRFQITAVDDGTPYQYGGSIVQHRFECPRCGTIDEIQNLWRNNDVLSIILVRGEVTKEKLEYLESAWDEFRYRMSKHLENTGQAIEEPAKAIIYGVLGGFTKDAIKESYYRLRDWRNEDDVDSCFDKELSRVLEQHRMKLCRFCSRAIRQADSFCDKCGRAQL